MLSCPQTPPLMRKRVWWTWAESLGLYWGISMCQPGRSSGTALWLAYCKNVASPYLLCKMNHPHQSCWPVMSKLCMTVSEHTTEREPRIQQKFIRPSSLWEVGSGNETRDYHYHIRQVTRTKSKSGAVVKHQRILKSVVKFVKFCG